MKLRNIKLTIKYDGTHYAGWQYQKNARTVQEAIETVLKKITGEKVNLTGSGRTDSGVHALAQVANFKTRSRLPLKRLYMALNSCLPDDIMVSAVEEAGCRFNAQHDAKSKIYRYTISNNDFVDPFIKRYAARCFYRIDVNTMRKAARCLLGRHDFSSFQTKDGEERDSTRRLKKIKIARSGDLIYIEMEADGFLYNMARNIVGTLIEAGRGKMTVRDVRAALDKKDRRSSGPTAPALGLCLMKVRY